MTAKQDEASSEGPTSPFALGATTLPSLGVWSVLPDARVVSKQFGRRPPAERG